MKNVSKQEKHDHFFKQTLMRSVLLCFFFAAHARALQVSYDDLKAAFTAAECCDNDCALPVLGGVQYTCQQLRDAVSAAECCGEGCTMQLSDCEVCNGLLPLSCGANQTTGGGGAVASRLVTTAATSMRVYDVAYADGVITYSFEGIQLVEHGDAHVAHVDPQGHMHVYVAPVGAVSPTSDDHKLGRDYDGSFALSEMALARFSAWQEVVITIKAMTNDHRAYTVDGVTAVQATLTTTVAGTASRCDVDDPLGNFAKNGFSCDALPFFLTCATDASTLPPKPNAPPAPPHSYIYLFCPATCAGQCEDATCNTFYNGGPYNNYETVSDVTHVRAPCEQFGTLPNTPFLDAYNAKLPANRPYNIYDDTDGTQHLPDSISVTADTIVATNAAYKVGFEHYLMYAALTKCGIDAATPLAEADVYSVQTLARPQEAQTGYTFTFARPADVTCAKVTLFCNYHYGWSSEEFALS